MTLSRRAARRTALFLLYQWDLTGQPIGTNYEGEIDDFARDLAGSVAANADELDARISAVSGDWPAGQLGTLERNVLRIGIHELDDDEALILETPLPRWLLSWHGRWRSGPRLSTRVGS